MIALVLVYWLTYPLDCERIACAVEHPQPEIAPFVYRELCGNCLPGYGSWSVEAVDQQVILAQVSIQAPVITTQGPGLRPPLAPTSSVSITRAAPVAQALAPAPTRTPFTWLEAHCGVDEDHPDVEYPPCGPGRTP